MTHTLTLRSKAPLTHDTHRYVFDRPEGYDFTPGQACHMALDRDGWRDEDRPFTFTSLPDEDRLEFTIKSYPDHDGVTTRLAELEQGDTVLVDDPSGAIEDRGDGVFIAGGAGVTPFIAILRNKLEQKGTLAGNTLVFSNATEDDIIMRQEFERMEGLRCHWTVTEETGSPLARGMIDAEMLRPLVDPDRDTAYVCGPPEMTDAVREHLESLGVPKERLIYEGWS